MSTSGAGRLRVVALIAVVAGAAGAVALLLRAGRRTPLFLLVIFVGWVLSPFLALGWAHTVSKRWSVLTRATLDWVTLVIAVGSLAIYYWDPFLRPAGSARAALFVVVAPASWLLMAIAVSIAALISRRRSRRAAAVLLAVVALSPRGYSEQPTVAVSAREGHVRGADGVSLFYRTIGESASLGVLLHGGPGSNMNGVWPDLQPLAESRTIVMYDQRGGGRSDIIKDSARLTATHHVRDLEALRANLGLQRFALIGESWGSGLAVLYAAAHPAQVERLLLIGPMPPTRKILDRRMDESDQAMGFRRRLAEVRGAMRDAPDPVATCREFFSLYLKQFFATLEGMARRRGSSCDGPPEGVRNYFVVNDATFASLGDWDFRPVLAGLTMPAMVVEGARSLPSSVESARVMAQSLPNATLVLVPEAGHYPQVERPEVFFPTVARFLAGDTPPKRR